MPRHHPSDEMLLGYASGSLSEPMALLVATHIALCPECREVVAAYEELGGDQLEDLEPLQLESDSLSRMLERLDQPAPGLCAATPGFTLPLQSAHPKGDLRLPQPLRDYVGGSLDNLKWRRAGGLAEARLLREYPGFITRLMQVKENKAILEHSHHGEEFALVLTGGFSDGIGHYVRGDVSRADPKVEHQPVADPGEDCICLIVTDAPVRFSNPIARLFSPILQG